MADQELGLAGAVDVDIDGSCLVHMQLRAELPDSSKAGKHKAFKTIQAAAVQQAFLPKFENEGQDTRIADAIVAGADER